MGLRFDYQNASAPAVDLPAARFVAARSFAEVTNVPLWKDLNPRLGLAYDLFGDGRTALKATLSRYVRGEAAGFARRNSPVHTTVNNATRTWNDRNGDFVPDEGELGPLSNVHFGEVVVRNRYDQDIKEGFGVRLMNWETSGWRSARAGRRGCRSLRSIIGVGGAISRSPTTSSSVQRTMIPTASRHLRTRGCQAAAGRRFAGCMTSTRRCTASMTV